MPFAPSGNARIYYEDHGDGEPVIAVHGLIENTRYYTKTGVSDILARHVRVIPMDMRGHGETRIIGDHPGYDVDSLCADIDAVADHLRLDRFHLLSHSTGGFAAVRYAAGRSDRLLSLMLTGTASRTSFFEDADQGRAFHDRFARSFETNSWERIMAGIRMQPFPFFRGIAERPDREILFQRAYDMVRVGDRMALGAFIRSFYTDPDPRIEGLRSIACPTLILVGDKDDLFIEPSRMMAREIPGARLVVFEDTGHMLAVERPEAMSREILAFLGCGR
ncbi:alpha/beta fold hydrolase [Desulfatiferula olefinivorans]